MERERKKREREREKGKKSNENEERTVFDRLRMERNIQRKR